MLTIVRKYIWCKRLGVRHPIRAAFDKNFMKFHR